MRYSCGCHNIYECLVVIIFRPTICDESSLMIDTAKITFILSHLMLLLELKCHIYDTV